MKHEEDMAESAAVADITAAEKEAGHKILPATTNVNKPTNGWDQMTDWIRQKTPAVIINNGSRINFGLKAIADSMGIASALGIRFTKQQTVKPIKSWPRFAANVITSATLIPGILYKEKPVSEEEIENYKKLSPVGYVFQKVKDAFDPKHHIVEMVALATVFNGVLTSWAGLQQSNFHMVRAFEWKSWKNISMEFVTGAFTTIAGLTLGLIPNRERAWQISTGAFTWRIPFKGAQAYTALFKGYPNANPPVPPGDWFQMSNFALQQAANVFGFFYAGIKKTEDGRIIHLGKDEENVDLDQEKIRGYNYQPPKKQAVDKEVPQNQVSNVEARSIAMPEQVAAQQQANVPA